MSNEGESTLLAAQPGNRTTDPSVYDDSLSYSFPVLLCGGMYEHFV